MGHYGRNKAAHEQNTAFQEIVFVLDCVFNLL
jgi:hypothetical protein